MKKPNKKTSRPTRKKRPTKPLEEQLEASPPTLADATGTIIGGDAEIQTGATSSPATQSRQEQMLESLRASHLFIATPCYGGMTAAPYMRSMVGLAIQCTQFGVALSVGTLTNESLVTRARNTLVGLFMDNPHATHLFFIDADIEFQPQDVLRLVGLDRDVVCGAYPKKNINWPKVKQCILSNPEADPHVIEKEAADYAINFTFNDDGSLIIENDLIKMKDASTGFMCIKRHVIEKMMAAHPELEYQPDRNDEGKAQRFFALFDTMIDKESRRYLSEDYAFCRLWQEMGGEIWMDPGILLNHYGTYAFEGQIHRMLESAIGQQPEMAS